ncbi:MAG: DUF123 domain-containing protein [Candidatus Methanomethylophilaceae archaeon]
MTMPGNRPERRKGTYALFVTLTEDMWLSVGSLGTILFEAGEYCYAGSAMNGLEQRIRRHLAHEKKMRWHIDRLTTVASDIEAYGAEYPCSVAECGIAKAASSMGFVPVARGFGSSDCGCFSHLLSVPDGGKAKLVQSLGMSRVQPLEVRVRECESL